MLEILYNTVTKRVRAWNGDDSVQGKYKPTPDQAVVIWDIPIPSFESGEYKVNKTNQTVIDGNPSYKPEPPRSIHISIIEAIDTSKARPARIKRVWEGNDYFYDCLVTLNIKDQYLAGDVKVGDYVIVFWSDLGEQIVTAKVFKSWQG